MRESSAPLGFSEDASIRAFHAAHAFRDALQTLLTVARSARFTVGMEVEPRAGSQNGKGQLTSNETRDALPEGKEVPSR